MKIKYWLIAIIFLGAILRLGFLGDRPFDGDEGVSLQFGAQANINQTLKIAQLDAHPPLLYLINYFSWHYLGQTEFWSRFLPALAGIILIYAIYKLTKEYFDEKIALITAFLVATSPHLIAFSQEDRMYSYFALFVISSLYFFTKALKDKDNYYFILLTLINAVLIYTHHIGWVIIGAEVLFWLYSLSKNRKIFIPFLLSFAITFALFLPIFNHTIYQFQGRSADQPIGISLKDSARGLAKAIYRFGGGSWLEDSSSQKTLYVIMFVIPVLITIYGFTLSFGKNKNKPSTQFIWLVITLSILVALFSQEVGKRAERTLLFLAPIYLIYTSIGIKNLWNRGERIQKNFSRGDLSRLLPIALVIIFIFSLYRHYFVFNKRNGANSIASFLGERLSPQDAIYIKGSFFSGDAFILKYYLDKLYPDHPDVPIQSYYENYKVGNLAQIRTKNEQTEVKKILAQPEIKRVWYYDFTYQKNNLAGKRYKLGLDKENQMIIVHEILT